MKNLTLLLFIITFIIGCEEPIKNGDVVYLALRKDKALSIKSNGWFQCSNTNKSPLVYIEQKDGNFILVTKDGRNVLFKNYYLQVKNEAPTIFHQEKLNDNIYIVSPANRYLSCNGKEVYQSDEPHITIHKY